LWILEWRCEWSMIWRECSLMDIGWYMTYAPASRRRYHHRIITLFVWFFAEMRSAWVVWYGSVANDRWPRSANIRTNDYSDDSSQGRLKELLIIVVSRGPMVVFEKSDCEGVYIPWMDMQKTGV
jgi:hypothetical protein